MSRVAGPGAFAVKPHRRNSAMARTAASYNVLAVTSTLCRMFSLSMNETCRCGRWARGYCSTMAKKRRNNSFWGHCKKQHVCSTLQFMGVLRPKRSRIEIEELLSAAMNTANEQRKQAVAEFLEVTAAVPHDSSADGILLIENAGAARQQAFAEYQISLNRFMDFVVSGIVPDDLK